MNIYFGSNAQAGVNDILYLVLERKSHERISLCSYMIRRCFRGAITFALVLQKFRLRLSYTCAHKSGAFALSFGVTLARIFSQRFLGQMLIFEPRC